MFKAQFTPEGRIPDLRNLCKFMILIFFVVVLVTARKNCESADTDKIRHNVLCIHALKNDSQCSGTGFVLNKERYWITANHIFQETSKLKINSCDYVNKCKGYLNEFIVDTFPQADVAVLKLPPEFGDIPECQEIEMVPNFSRKYVNVNDTVKLWTACTSEGPKIGKIIKVMQRHDTTLVYVDGGRIKRISKGDSGSPVTLIKTGQLVGMVVAVPNELCQFDPKIGEWCVEEPIAVELVSAETIKGCLPKNPGNFLIASAESERKQVDATPMGGINQQLNALEDYMNSIMERKTMMFMESNMDLAINASLEAASFIRKMRQRKEILTEDKALAVKFYIRGLETKATKNDGFKEAMEYFRMALDLDSTFAEPRYQFALYNLRYIGNMVQARNDLDSALKYDSENPEVIRSLVVYYLKNFQYDTALVYLKKAEELLPLDPRIPLYWGAYYDPAWPPDSVREKFSHFDFEKARVYYIKSLQVEPYFITPANNINQNLLTELIQSDAQVKPTRKELEQREELLDKLRTGLWRLQPCVDWGFRDPRILETFSHGYAYLSAKEPDKVLKKKDCQRACDYVTLINQVLERSQFPPRDAESLREGLQYSDSICHCIVKQNIVCINSLEDHGAKLLGSGLILTKDGCCITPYHIVNGISKLEINSKYYAKNDTNYTDSLLIKRGEVEDIAPLRLRQGFVDSSSFKGLKMVDSVTEKLVTQPVWVCTLCTGEGFKDAIIQSVNSDSEKIYITGVTQLRKSDSGSPVILKETGELVGLVGACINPVKVVVDRKTKDTLWVQPQAVELISAGAIRKLLQDKSITLVQ